MPLNVRAVLEEKSQKYQQIISFNSKISDNLRAQSVKKEQTEGTSEKLLNTNNKERMLSKPVVIPSSVNMNSLKKMAKTKNEIKPIEPIKEEKILTDVRKVGPMFEDKTKDELETVLEQQIQEQETEQSVETETKKRRGRPRKNPVSEQDSIETPKRGRGRPRKNPALEEQENIVLPGLDEEKPEDVLLPGFQDETEEQQEDVLLPGFEEEPENVLLPGFQDETEEQPDNATIQQETSIQNINQSYENIDISNLLTSDKKVACFIGTSKNGTSFIVNNLAEITSKMGIDTAILDTTKNRNAYYIYTKNEESLRKTAMESINNLLQGVANGIQVNKNLTVYTSLPDETDGIENAGVILQTLLKKHSLVLIDCDFETPLEYFEKTQEIYLVQSFDILTIQPLTAFLRELKSKNILKEEKLRIILNKTVKVRGINDKTIIGGMAYYNDPAMSFMTELFNKNTIRYITIPFNEEVYTKYLENVINCEISVKGYPKNIIQILNELSNIVYPLVSGKSTYVPPRVETNGFTPSMNSTLNQMKNRY